MRRKAKSEQKQCDRCKRYYKDQQSLDLHIIEKRAINHVNVIESLLAIVC